jgi:hypothetical protein
MYKINSLEKSSSILLVLTIFMIENDYFVVAIETKKVNIVQPLYKEVDKY